jgi:hypothetical protein
MMVETPTEFVQLDTTYLVGVLGNLEIDSPQYPHGPTVEFLHTMDQIHAFEIMISEASAELKLLGTGRNTVLPDITPNPASSSYELGGFTGPQA